MPDPTTPSVPENPAAPESPAAPNGPTAPAASGVEFIGMIGTQDASETRPPSGPVIDRDYTVRFARAHEDAGFDRILIGYSSSRPDGAQVAAYVAARTERLGLLVAHRPGFIAPTLAARSFATLDQFSGGRVAVHTITGGNDTEQRRDGDYLDKEERYDRTDEYLTILRRAWSSAEPFSHEGRHYRFEEYGSEVLPVHASGIPLYFGGSSEAAYRVGGRHADTFALWGEPLAETAEQIASVRAAAVAAGRTAPPGISVSFRPILGATEELAWERAHRILDTIKSGAGRPSSTRRAITRGRAARRTPARRTSVRSGCSPPRRRAISMTARSGPRRPPPPGRAATPPPSSAPRRPSRVRCSTMSTSARPRCSSVDTTRWTTPSRTGGS